MGTYAEREARFAERRDYFKKQAAVPRVRVLPKNEQIRKTLFHPLNGKGTIIRFPKEGSVEWPMDNFTRRRLRDGDITIVKEDEAKAADKPASELGGEPEQSKEYDPAAGE